MDFQFSALPMSRFDSLFPLDDKELVERNVGRVVADGHPAYPCRVSLQDAAEGEELLLLHHLHHEVDSPYRASGPIYVRKSAVRAVPRPGEVPELLRRRLVSLRAYDAAGMMQAAVAVLGTAIESTLGILFDLDGTSYVHVHFAQPGCYACRVDRA